MEQNLELLAMKIRRDVLDMILHRGYGHMGGSLSIVECMAALYGGAANVDPANPDNPMRDYIVLSKGHAGPAWYAALAQRGFFPHDWLYTLNDNGTRLPSHPNRKKTPGVDATTGSLGQGTSIAAGMALAQKLKQLPGRTFVITGDGELDEGQCWEAFQFMAAKNLDNLTVLIDENKRQLDGTTKDVLDLKDLAKKMEAFGFDTQKVDSANVYAIKRALKKAKVRNGRPHAIILDGIKGQGVPYFENLANNHSVKFTDPEMEQETKAAIAELERRIAHVEAGC